MPSSVIRRFRYDAVGQRLTVTFTSGDLVHKRDVNAVVGANGKYDAKATKARVAEVARGVAEKISLGVIVTPPTEENEAPGDAGLKRGHAELSHKPCCRP